MKKIVFVTTKKIFSESDKSKKKSFSDAMKMFLVFLSVL